MLQDDPAQSRDDVVATIVTHHLDAGPVGVAPDRAGSRLLQPVYAPVGAFEMLLPDRENSPLI